jgi:hypothetical protein
MIIGFDLKTRVTVRNMQFDSICTEIIYISRTAHTHIYSDLPPALNWLAPRSTVHIESGKSVNTRHMLQSHARGSLAAAAHDKMIYYTDSYK